MINYIRAAVICLLVISGPAMANAADVPSGEWQVKDGSAHVRILACKEKLWGIISWVKPPAGKDDNNPNPALRSRSVLGMPILLGMQEQDGEWKGDIYNSDNGKTYQGSVGLKPDGLLHVKGCVMGGFLCGGESWASLPSAVDEEDDAKLCRRL